MAGSSQMAEAATQLLLSKRALPKREQLVLIASLAGITALAWLYLIVLAGHMSSPMETSPTMETAGMSMNGMAMPSLSHISPQLIQWSPVEFFLLFLMWAIMMVGMMLPSAMPMILLFAGVSRSARQQGQSAVPVSLFVFGYLLAWTGFSLLAALVQGGLERAALLSPMMISVSPWLGGLLLIGAGVYQWSPIKERCLTHCRSPFTFVAGHWRQGNGGALQMGLHHGVYCLGCCWLLMGLLFVGGVMNLLWVAAIAGFVLIEKLLPAGLQAGRIGGVLLCLMGVVVIVRG
jgi:predicted metal-binding membrane protein